MSNSNMFHMSLKVISVKLFDHRQAINTCPLGLSFRFPGLVRLEILEGEFCGPVAAGGAEVRMAEGRSCLFAVDPCNVFQTVRQFYADVGVYRYVGDGQDARLVAQTRIEFKRTFTDLIEIPDQPDRKRELKQVRCTGSAGKVNDWAEEKKKKKQRNVRTLRRRFTCTRWNGRARWARWMFKSSCYRWARC
jgi:hypothetical protein